jgi:hypothetical protein
VIDHHRSRLHRTAAQSQVTRYGTRATDRGRASVVDLSALIRVWYACAPIRPVEPIATAYHPIRRRDTAVGYPDFIAVRGFLLNLGTACQVFRA